MHFFMKLMKRAAIIALLSSGPFAVSGVIYAATLNQNLFYLEELPIVVDLDGSLPVRTVMLPQRQAQAKAKAPQPAAITLTRMIVTNRIRRGERIVTTSAPSKVCGSGFDLRARLIGLEYVRSHRNHRVVDNFPGCAG